MDKYREERTASDNRSGIPTGLGAPAIPGLSGDANTSAGLDRAHPGLDQAPIPGLDLELTFPTSTTHIATLSRTELVLQRTLEPKRRQGVSIGSASTPAVHEQAMRRLAEVTGLVPVEYPTTRQVGASPQSRAADINAAFADPSIRAIVATVGGEDQIQVVPHLNPKLARADPKPFCGYSDNTNLLSWLWTHGIAGFYGGSTQVHLGPGPAVDACHRAALRSALITGERLEVTDPGESGDIGKDWADPAALTEYGEREATEPWAWAGPATSVTGTTWGGCIEVIQWILTAGRFPQDPAILDGGVLLLEASEELIPAREFGWILRSLGERGLLAAVAAVLVARPPASDLSDARRPAERADHRAAQRDAAIALVAQYNPDAVVCVGVPFGHTRPQWLLPYDGHVTVDGAQRTIWADYH